jgi:hypothetical protein
MTVKCPNCDQVIPDDAPYTGSEIEQAVTDRYDWGSVRYSYTARKVREFQISVRGTNEVLTIVEVIEPLMPSNEYDRQGETYKRSLILQVRDVYYRKDAHVDSYGDETWSGSVYRVTPTEKTVLTWE